MGNTIGNICSSNISIHHHMVDCPSKEKWEEKWEDELKENWENEWKEQLEEDLEEESKQ